MMREAWVVIRYTKLGKQYLAGEFPKRIWMGRLGRAKIFFREDDARREAAGRYYIEKITV